MDTDLSNNSQNDNINDKGPSETIESIPVSNHSQSPSTSNVSEVKVDSEDIKNKKEYSDHISDQLLESDSENLENEAFKSIKYLSDNKDANEHIIDY